MCKAIRDLMDDSREEGIALGTEQMKVNFGENMLKKGMSDVT